VAVGERRPTNGFACGASLASDPFEEILAAYGNGPRSTGAESDDPAASGVAGRRKTRTNEDSGVLPAVGERLRTLPEALPALTVPSGGSPTWILGIGALLVLLISGVALVLYFVRFVRGPHTT
jgi:hypothetical protein